MESEEKRSGVTGGAAWSRRRSRLESEDERQGVIGEAAWSRSRSDIKVSIITDISGDQLEDFETNFHLSWSLPLIDLNFNQPQLQSSSTITQYGCDIKATQSCLHQLISITSEYVIKFQVLQESG